jgi:hypothetical protein
VAPRPHPTMCRRAYAAIATVIVAVTAAACSSTASGRAATPAAPLLLQAGAAVASASAVRIHGSIVEKSGSATDSLLVDATSAGTTTSSEGTLDLEGPGLGFSGLTSYVIVGSTTWVNGGTKFWDSYFGKQTPTVKVLEAKVFPQLLGHWIELAEASTETMYKDALGLSEPRVFVTATLSGIKGTLSNSGNQTVNGVSGIQISSSTGTKIIVAGSGAPLPAELADMTNKSGSFVLSLAVSYPTGVTIKAPTHFAVLSTVLEANAST